MKAKIIRKETLSLSLVGFYSLRTAEIFKSRSENQSRMKSFINIFRPFSMNTRDLYVGDCFFYPQRFVAAALLSYVTLIYIIVSSFGTIDTVSDM